jgi:phosphoesterase RecJ-like protein
MGISMQAAGEALRDLVKGLKGRKVAVLGHMRPDGDCIGSQVALCRILLAAGIDTLCVNRDRVPLNMVSYTQGLTFLTGDQYVPDGRVAVAVDCADASRIGPDLLDKFGGKLWGNIDHHASNPGYAQHNIVVKTAAATCHVLAYGALRQNLGCDTATAKALHLGIVTDTGRFSYASATAEVFALAAELIERGANPAETNFLVFEHESRGKLELTKRFLNSIQFHEDGKICSGELTQADYAATGTTKEDKEGLVEFPRSVEGVEIAVLMEEGRDGVRGSLRGRDPRLRLDLLAGKLNGGGHVLAAGFNMLGCTLAKDRGRILGIVAEHYRQHTAQ